MSLILFGKKSWIIPNTKIQKVKKKKPFSHAKEKNHRGSYVTNFMELIIFVLKVSHEQS